MRVTGYRGKDASRGLGFAALALSRIEHWPWMESRVKRRFVVHRRSDVEMLSLYYCAQLLVLRLTAGLATVDGVQAT